jgi:hypothetical protein
MEITSAPVPSPAAGEAATLFVVLEPIGQRVCGRTAREASLLMPPDHL